LQGQFVAEEWGGANEVHLLKNGYLGVIGHIACFDQYKNKHYYSMVFAFNPKTKKDLILRMLYLAGV
jgi:hypothetical protein